MATGFYRHADASRPISCDSPRRADSKETLPDSGEHLPPEVAPAFHLLTSIALRIPRNIHHSIPLDQWILTHPVPMLTDPWLKGYPNISTRVPRVTTFTLLATECYRHADTTRSIPFNSPRRADSNETLPDSGGHLPAAVSPFFSLLTSIALPIPRNIHHSFPLDRRIPTQSVPMLSDPWSKDYPNICT